jgi:hypothetical protein
VGVDLLNIVGAIEWRPRVEALKALREWFTVAECK